MGHKTLAWQNIKLDIDSDNPFFHRQENPNRASQTVLG